MLISSYALNAVRKWPKSRVINIKAFQVRLCSALTPIHEQQPPILFYRSQGLPGTFYVVKTQPLPHGSVSYNGRPMKSPGWLCGVFDGKG